MLERLNDVSQGPAATIFRVEKRSWEREDGTSALNEPIGVIAPDVTLVF
jgi:hypothetical protein